MLVRFTNTKILRGGSIYEEYFAYFGLGGNAALFNIWIWSIEKKFDKKVDSDSSDHVVFKKLFKGI